jgi:hypothetical protein
VKRGSWEEWGEEAEQNGGNAWKMAATINGEKEGGGASKEGLREDCGKRRADEEKGRERGEL